MNKSISNKVLLTFSLAVVVAGGFCFSITFGKDNQWVELQSKNLLGVLSGQTHVLGDNHDLPTKIVNLPILMYHHVGPLPENANDLTQDLTVSAEAFELQVAWLKGQGFEAVTLSDLHPFGQNKLELPANPIVFTFDDGYQDAFENAVPILQKYGFRGSFAVVTQFPGITAGSNKYATWDQVKKAAKDGMDIVSHTQDHFDGTSNSYDKKFILRNLREALSDLETNAGVKTKVLVYPFGHYDKGYIKLAKEAGYEMGVTTKNEKIVSTASFMEVPRLRVHGKQSMESFQKLVLQ